MGAVAAIAAVGTIISAAGQQKAAAAQARAGRAQRAAAEKQAKEILFRAKENIKDIRKEGEEIKSSQVSGFAKAGVDIATGSPLLALEKTRQSIRRDEFKINRQAEADADITRAGGRVAEQAANAQASATRTSSIATLLQGGAKIAGGIQGKTNAQNTPKIK